MVKEIITNFVNDDGFGSIRHAFVSPDTHWAENVCEVVVRMNAHKVYDIHLSYGSGGCKPEATQVEVAHALSRAFQLAGARLEQLYKEHGYEAS